MNQLHQLHGNEGWSRFWLWGLIVDVVSVSMILFALSGVYMWYVLKKDRRLGWIVLGARTLYVVGLVIFLVLRS